MGNEPRAGLPIGAVIASERLQRSLCLEQAERELANQLINHCALNTKHARMIDILHISGRDRSKRCCGGTNLLSSCKSDFELTSYVSWLAVYVIPKCAYYKFNRT